ncbi:MAG: DNA cytosine methyltransferase [Alphaproteobacteria bacterium]|nr:DNA cytosine methyltransferase [Alphaproteobacteria bacterium]
MQTKYQLSNAGLYVPERLGKLARAKDRPTAFSFFAGCGGVDLGFIQAGFEIVGANEFDECASLTYMVNLGSYPMQIHYIGGEADKKRLNAACEKHVFGGKGRALPKEGPAGFDTPFGLYNTATGSRFAGSGWIAHNPQAAPVRNFWFGDVRKLTGKAILDALGMKPGELDCVCGGPPCQGFSQAGRQNIADPRNNLVYEFGRLIVELQPKTFIMEEVPAIINFMDPDGVPVLDKFAMMISEGGYGKWDTIKKGMMMQAGCAGGIKSMRDVGGMGKRKPKQKIKNHEKPSKKASVVQASLFDDLDALNEGDVV